MENTHDDFKLMAFIEKALFVVCAAFVAISGVGVGLGHKHCIFMVLLWGILAAALWKSIKEREEDKED